MALDHIGIHCKDYEGAVEFYDSILTTLGNKKKMSVESPQGRGTGFGKTAPTFWIHGPPVDAVETKPYGPVHVAFAASTRAAVDRFYEAAIAAGAKCNGKPGYRPYHPFYYAAFVIDKDGNNIEAVNHFDVTSWKVGLPLIVLGLALSIAYMKYWAVASSEL